MLKIGLFILGLICVCPIQGCNEAICASVITRCQIAPYNLGKGSNTAPCMCDTKEYYCVKNCFDCLGNLFSECCSCLDLCPKKSYVDDATASQIQDFPSKLVRTGMFGVLTEFDDPLERWTTETFKIDTDTWTTVYKGDKEWGYKKPNRNCTVAYVSDCLSWKKCKNLCVSMGSSSARWFFDGCCQCVGPYCVQHGLSKSKCLRCPIPIEEDDEHTDIDESYFDDEDYEDELEHEHEMQQAKQSVDTPKQNTQ